MSVSSFDATIYDMIIDDSIGQERLLKRKESFLEQSVAKCGRSALEDQAIESVLSKAKSIAEKNGSSDSYINLSLPGAKLEVLDGGLPESLQNITRSIRKSLVENKLIEAIRLAHQHGIINFLDEEGNTFLHTAVLKEDLEALKLCISYGVDLNKKNNQEVTPLGIAAVDGLFNIAQIILQAGADPSIACYETQRTPAVTAYYHQDQQMMTLLQLTPLERANIARQELSYCFDLEDEFSDSPPNPRWSFSYIASISSDQVVKNAFIKASNPYRDLYEDLEKDEVVVAHASTLDHAIVLVFMKIKGEDVLAICNRGFGRNGASIQYFAVDRGLFEEEHVEMISYDSSIKSVEEEGVLESFYEDLPEQLAPEDSKIEEDLLILQELIKPKPQKKDNCTLASAKAAVGAIIAGQTYNLCFQSHSLERMKAVAKQRYKKELSFPLREFIKKRAIEAGVDIEPAKMEWINKKLGKYTT